VPRGDHPGRPGRPRILTPEVIEAVTRELKAGNHREVAIAAAGITRDTFARWIREADTPVRPLELPRPPAGRRKADRQAWEEECRVLRVRRIRELRARVMTRRFSDAVREAEAFAERALVGRLQMVSMGRDEVAEEVTETITVSEDGSRSRTRRATRNSPMSVAATTFLLERRFPERWAPRREEDLAGPDHPPIGGAVLEDPEALELARRLRDRHVALTGADEPRGIPAGEAA
jgi:hypothetical protein